jgi:phage tail sheath protein FI
MAVRFHGRAGPGARFDFQKEQRMPQTYTYPGVYVEEVPSEVRTIAGASTSDTAFVDFFLKGPVNEPVRITTFGDFERTFGGLDNRSAASFAIQQYFLNLGSVAYVVRVTAGTTGTASVELTAGASDILAVDASSPGAWAEDRIRVILPAGADTGLFNLKIEEVEGDDSTGVVLNTEDYFSLSMDPAHPRYALAIVNSSSSLVRLRRLSELDDFTAPTTVPASPANRTQGGADGDIPGETNWRTNTGGTALKGSTSAKTGIHALDEIVPLFFNLLCIPAAAALEDADMRDVYSEAITYVEGKRAFLILDIPSTTTTPDQMKAWQTANASLGSKNAAVYFPRIVAPNALRGALLENMPASGAIAGVYARTDAQRGVWKAPAGTEALLRGANLAYQMDDGENGGLNPLGLNALRTFPVFGPVVWGARTMDGADQKASQYKYIPIRRLALFIEESLYQGLKWVVFEPNDFPLWSQIRLNVGAFMNSLFRQGAFQGQTAREAYFVKVDSETTTQNDIDRGIVNIVVGFAPLKPAEFVVLKIQQMAGQIQT